MASSLERRLADDATPRETATVAMAVIDRVQQYPKGDRAVGMAAAFLILCESLGVDPRRALEIAGNVMRAATYRQENAFSAVKLFMEREVRA